MIKDILVNLSYGTSQDGVSNYAVSVAETFGAHIVGIAFAYPVVAGGVGLPTQDHASRRHRRRRHSGNMAATTGR
jgi:hypothetical protein